MNIVHLFMEYIYHFFIIWDGKYFCDQVAKVSQNIYVKNLNFYSIICIYPIIRATEFELIFKHQTAKQALQGPSKNSNILKCQHI